MPYNFRSDNMNQKQIGIFLKKCRENKKLTIEEVAQHLKTTPRLIKKWEKGQKVPSIDYLPGLSALLEVPIIDIIRGDQVKNDNEFLLALDYYIKKITSFYIRLTALSILLMTIIFFIIFYNFQENKVYYFYNTDRTINVSGYLIKTSTEQYLTIKNLSFNKNYKLCQKENCQQLKVKNLSLALQENKKIITSTQIYLPKSKAFLKNLVNNNTLEFPSFPNRDNLFLEVTYQTDNDLTETTNIKLTVKELKTLFK